MIWIYLAGAIWGSITGSLKHFLFWNSRHFWGLLLFLAPILALVIGSVSKAMPASKSHTSLPPRYKVFSVFPPMKEAWQPPVSSQKASSLRPKYPKRSLEALDNEASQHSNLS